MSTTIVLSFDLENVGQGHHLQKLLYVSYDTKNYQICIDTMSMLPATKMSAYLENVDQCHRLQKLLYLGSYMTDFNQTFTK